MRDIYERVGPWQVMAPDHDLLRRPISISRDGITVTMTADEAVELAHSLVRIVEQHREAVATR